jgi:hypothetical protein
VHRRVARCQAQSCHPAAVSLGIAGAIVGTQHIAILSDGRPYIFLAEFDQHIAVYGAQTPVYLIHQRVDAGRERFYVASGIILSHSRISSREFEPVYKVKLKPVDIPVAESRLIQIA